MKFEVFKAKNGELTLSLNNINIYSKYYPAKNAEEFIISEFNYQVSSYLLIGLGLGYHLKSLLRLTKKKIYILLIDQNETELFYKYSNTPEILSFDNVEVINFHTPQINFEDLQVIIPNVWLKAIGHDHQLFSYLEDIKIRQMSIKQSYILLEDNFLKNIQNDNNLYLDTLENLFLDKQACLVSAGPSLNETVKWLKKINHKIFILCVGSALKVLLRENISPDAVIITDPSDNVNKQINDSNYQGTLFYLSTANHEMTKLHHGKKIILLQHGYSLAELFALKHNKYLIDTGGSVATAGISLIEKLGFKQLFLFGQDLGFKNDRTHSFFSTSGIEIASNFNFRKITANSGEIINTTSNLSTYHRWIERKAIETSMKIYNTSWHGAKIKNIPYLSEDEFFREVHLNTRNVDN